MNMENSTLSKQDENLKQIYMLGFNDELYSEKPVDWFSSEVEKKAYFKGRNDAFMGIDISLNDDKSWKDILNYIKKL